MLQKIGKTTLIIMSALVISGCKEAIVDARNIEISNGLIYKSQDNEPFTGLVTNLPIKDLNEQGLGHFFLDTTQALSKYSTFQERLNYIELICNRELINGYISGLTECFTPKSGTPRLRAHYDSGLLNGKTELLAADGSTILASSQFKKGKADGALEIYSTKNGKLILRQETTEGLVNGLHEQWNEETGSITHRLEFGNGVPVKKETWSPHGIKTSETFYKDGKIHGTYSEWNGETGALIQEVEFINNIRSGRAKVWSPPDNAVISGVFEAGEFYPDQEPAEETSDNKTAPDSSCVEKWADAHIESMGEGSMIRNDQVVEWESWCSEGKLP